MAENDKTFDKAKDDKKTLREIIFHIPMQNRKIHKKCEPCINLNLFRVHTYQNNLYNNSHLILYTRMLDERDQNFPSSIVSIPQKKLIPSLY